MAKCRELTRCSAQTAVSGQPKAPRSGVQQPQIESYSCFSCHDSSGVFSFLLKSSSSAAIKPPDLGSFPARIARAFFYAELRCCPKAQALSRSSQSSSHHLSFHAAKREQEAWTRDLDSGVRREVGDATGRNVWGSLAVSRATGEMARMNRAGLLLWAISDGSLLSRVLGDGILGVIYQPSILTFLGSWRRRCSRAMFSGVELVRGRLTDLGSACGGVKIEGGIHIPWEDPNLDIPPI
jgi:hypothetical protein